MNQDYFREVERLSRAWADRSKSNRALHEKDAFWNALYSVQDGLHGIGKQWEAEAEERRLGIPRPYWKDDQTPETDFLEFCEFGKFVESVNYYLVAKEMVSVAEKMLRKTYEGRDQSWFGYVGMDGDTPVFDDKANNGVAFSWLINEEVKLRQGGDFSILYQWLRICGRADEAHLNLVAYVRSNLSLDYGHDLWNAVKHSGSHLETNKAFLLELRSELVEPLSDLTPHAIKTLPNKTAYRIRKRWLGIKDIDGFVDLETCADPAKNIQQSVNLADHLSEAFNAEIANEMFYDEAEKAGLSTRQADIIKMKRISGMKLDSIAEQLEISPGSVYQHYNRAKKKLDLYKKNQSK